MKFQQTLSTEDRFWKYVDKSGDCWLWTGSLKKGYGEFRVRSRAVSTRRFVMIGAHRFMWELVYGGHPCMRTLLPSSVFVCHRCDVNYPRDDYTYRRCVRPEHLFVGTHTDNMRDMERKGRGRRSSRYLPLAVARLRAHPELLLRGEKHPHAKLTDNQVRELRVAHAEALRGRRRVRRGWMQMMVSRHQIGSSALKAAISGKTWAHVK